VKFTTPPVGTGPASAFIILKRIEIKTKLREGGS
jgi:hypothetical protein